MSDTLTIEGLRDYAMLDGERLLALWSALDAVTHERDEAYDRLQRSGFVRCDIPACNCGSWHQRYGLPERMQEIEQTLEDAGHPLNNDNGHLIRNALAQLVNERDALRAEVERLRAALSLYRFDKDMTGQYGAEAALQEPTP